jgi:hypothetical protein
MCSNHAISCTLQKATTLWLTLQLMRHANQMLLLSLLLLLLLLTQRPSKL